MSGFAFAFASPVALPSVRRRPRTCPLAPEMRGPSTPPPDYSSIDANPVNQQLTNIFRGKLEAEIGRPARSPGYAGVVEVAKALAHLHRGDPAELRTAAERVLESLFPAWLPPAFDRIFSRNVPGFAKWINAVVTVAVTQWLMGPSKLTDGGATVEIERCRYLEETGCVGICVHSCKAATEGFFQKNMGIGLAIEPNLDDYSCKFRFGESPLPESEDPMYQESCFATCPLSKVHSGTACNSVTGIEPS